MSYENIVIKLMEKYDEERRRKEEKRKKIQYFIKKYGQEEFRLMCLGYTIQDAQRKVNEIKEKELMEEIREEEKKRELKRLEEKELIEQEYCD